MPNVMGEDYTKVSYEGSSHEKQSELCIATDLDDIEKNGLACSTLLSVLDDKNRAISHLQQQIQNQKMQLSYYIQKGLSNQKITELSKTCVSQAVDENIQLTLAMNIFYKQTGLKSKLVVVHERMAYIDGKIQAILQHQEALIREIVGRLLTCRNTSDELMRQSVCLTQFSIDSRSLNMFNSLLNATINLGKELDTFRICCNRLILIEDERNILAEQVYSMPVEKRVCCNQMMSLHAEKRELDREMMRIREEQNTLEKKLQCLRIVQQKVREFYDSGVCTDDCSQSTQLCQLLDTVKSDALSLLTITKEQKQKYDNDVGRLREENETLKTSLQTMGSVLKEKNELTDQVKRLEYYVTSLNNNNSEKAAPQNQAEIDSLRRQLKAITEDRDVLREALTEASTKLTQLVQIVQQRSEEIEKLQRERDSYKSQVEDLEAIRTAYSQLVDYPSDSSGSDSLEKEKKIEALDCQRQTLDLEVRKLTQESALQEKHIKQLLSVIEKLGVEKENQVTIGCGRSLQMLGKDVSTSQLLVPLSEEMKINYEKEFIPANELEIPNFSAPKLFEDADELLAPAGCGAGDDQSKFKLTNAEIRKINQFENRKANEDTGKSCNDSFKRPIILTTSFEVHSTDKHGRQESVRAVLESTTPVEGTIKMDEKNHLFFNLKCANAQENMGSEMKSNTENTEESVRKTTPLNFTPEDAIAPDVRETHSYLSTKEIDEYELMRDCSEEILKPPPLNRQFTKEERINISSFCSSDNMKISKTCSRETYEVHSTPEVLVTGTRPQNKHINFISCANLERNEQITESKIDRRNLMATKIKLIATNVDKTVKGPGGKRLC